MRASLLLVIAGLALTGCYPAAVKFQPQARIIVHDADGKPLPDATVTLATYQMPFGSAARRELTAFPADAEGRVVIESKRKWHWQLILPDGQVFYDWHYCIASPGHVPRFSYQAEFDEPVNVALQRGGNDLVCRWPGRDESVMDVRYVEREKGT